jgi:lia operon protein LiaG
MQFPAYARAVTRCALGGALLLSTPAVRASGQELERYSVGGDAVAIYNLAGSVRVESGTGANVVIEVRRGGADADRLDVARVNVNGRSALVIRYPDGDVVYDGGSRGHSSTTTVRVRADGTFFGDGDRGERITVRTTGHGTRAHADLRVLVPAGRSVDLRLGIGDVSVSGVTGDLDIDVGAASVATRGTRGRLRIDTGSGRVTVDDARGDVVVDTGSGSVDLNAITGDDLHVDTGSGSVRGADINAANILIDTGSGSVRLTGVATRSVEIDTGSGSVDLDLTTDVERVLIDTGSGGVRLTVPESLGASFDIDGSSVSIDVPATFSRRERGRATGTIGDGRGTIEIDTGSGRVSIVRG